MPLIVELRRRDGTVIRRNPHPSGGTFDAAGNFDRLLGNDAYPVLSTIDPYTDTTWDRATMPALMNDIAVALDEARSGSERRGLLRLQVFAERCRDHRDLLLVFLGD
jgi:hypothetical protein